MGDYTLTALTQAATITAKALAASGLATSNKTYNGTTADTITGTPALLTAETAGSGTTADGKPYTGDTVTVGGTAAGTFASKDVANGIAVTVSGNTLSGAQAGDYAMAANEENGLTANITPKTLTVSGLAASAKTYNATTADTITGTPALLTAETGGSGTTSDDKPYTGDTVTVGGTAAGTFAAKDVANGVSVTVSGNTLGGAQARDYVLAANEQSGLTANITAKTLTVSGLAASGKTYNATAAATLSGTPALLTAEAAGSGTTADGTPYTGDTLTLGGTAAGSFPAKNVGTALTVTVSGNTLGGAQAGDYVLAANEQSGLTANITQAPLTVSATGVNKPYDGTTTATVTLSDNHISGDVVTDSDTSAAFSNKNVGNNITVTVSGISISGTDAGNYALQNTTATTTANITQPSPPVVSVPGSQSVNEATNLTISPISISDADTDITSYQVTLSDLFGGLTLASTTGLTFTSGANGTSSMVFTGSKANVGSALASIVYLGPNYFYGSDTITLAVNDQDAVNPPQQTTETIGVTVNRVVAGTTPTSIGTAVTSTSTITTLAFTLNTSVAAGSTVIVSLLSRNETAGGVSAVDNASGGSNTYHLDADVNTTSGDNCHTSILSTQVTHALASGNTITVTFPSSTQTAIQAYQDTGLAGSSTLDQTQKATGSSTTPSSGNTATTSQASELVFGAFTYHVQTTFTAGTNLPFTALATSQPSGGTRSLSTEYADVSATGQYAATGTIGSSAEWAAAVATYKVAGGAAPTVSAVSSSDSSGPYGVGTVVPITITYSSPVYVFGTPQLALNSGGTAAYASGSGTTTLTFNYTVGAGQSASDLDYSSTSALTLNSGYMYDAYGNAAGLALPATGSDGLYNKSIKIETTPPTSTITFPAAAYYNATGWGSGAISGSATAIGTGNSVSKVQVSIENTTTGQYWNGSNAFSGAMPYLVTASGTTSWNYTLAASYLTSGDSYTVGSTATDVAGNVQATAVAATFTYDTTPPTATIAFPANNIAYNAAGWGTGTILGTASDTVSGVKQVQVSIENTTTSKYWNGSTFGNGTADFLAASGTTSWTYTLAAGNLTSGDSYTVTVQITDNAGNTSSPAAAFNYDATPPTSAIAFPAASGNYNAAGWSGGLSGTAAATGAGNSVSNVQVSIENNTTGRYWNGSNAFSGTTSYLITASGTTSWNYTLAASYLTSGDSYTVDSTASDIAGNVQTTATAATFTYDTTPPAATIAVPANNAAYNAAGWTGAISGTAADAETGVANVRVSIENTTTQKYWNGSSFGNSTADYLTASGTTTWTYTLAASNLTNGDSYAVAVQATDNAGNVETGLTAAFNYYTTPPTSAIAFPTAAYYNAAGWGSGTISGTAAATGAGNSVSKVQVSIENNTTGQYWNGSNAFSGTTPYLITAGGTTSWNYTLAASYLTSGDSYTVDSTATDSAGNAQSGATAATFTFDNIAPVLTLGAITTPTNNKRPTFWARRKRLRTTSAPLRSRSTAAARSCRPSRRPRAPMAATRRRPPFCPTARTPPRPARATWRATRAPAARSASRSTP